MKNVPASARLFTALALLAGLAAPTAHAATVTPPADLIEWVCTGHCGSLGPDGDITSSPLGNPRYGYVSTAGSAAFGVSPLSLGDNKVGIETNGSRMVSGSFSATTGDTLALRFNYISTDGNGYDDYAWARVIDASDALVAWVFSARSTNSGSKQIVPGDLLKKDEFDPDEMVANYDDFEFNSKTADWSPLGASNNSCWETDAKGCGNTGWLESRFTFSQSGQYRLEVGVTNWGDTAYDSGLAFDYLTLADTTVYAPVPEPGRLSLMLAGLGLLVLAARRRA
jgi:hypothetical protein